MDGCGGGGVGGAGMDDSWATEMGPEETKVEAIMLMSWVFAAASLYLYLKISALTALRSAWRDWICCCNAEIAPMQP